MLLLINNQHHYTEKIIKKHGLMSLHQVDEQPHRGVIS